MHEIFARRHVVVCLLAAGALAGASSPAAAQEGLRLYVPTSNSNNVAVFTTNGDGTLTSTATIDVGSASTFAVVRGDQAFAYVTIDGADQLKVIDTRTNTVVQTVTTGDGPRGVAVSPDGRLVYVANNNAANSVSVFSADVVTGQLTAVTTIATGAASNPRHVVFSPDGSRAFIGNQGTGANGRIHVVDTATHAITATIATGSQMLFLAINPDGTRLYATDSANRVSVVDTAAQSVIATPAVGTNSFGITTSPDGRFFYVTSNNDFNVRQFDASTNTQVGAAVATGFNPRALAASPDGRFAYIPRQGTDDDVAVFSIDSSSGVLTNTGSEANTGDNPEVVGLCRGGNAMLSSGRTFVANTAGALGCTGGTPTLAGGTLVIGADGLTLSNAIAIGSAGGNINTNGNSGTLSGVLSGSGSLTKSGMGALTLAAANTYTGATTVSGGHLRAGAGNAFPAASAFTIGSEGTLDLNGFGQTIGSLSGAGFVTLGGASLSTGADNSSTSYGGVISGSGSVIKVGSGTFTLTGANTYTGGTTISGGRLVVSADGNLGATSSQLTFAGGSLQLAGSFSTGRALVFNGDGSIDSNGFDLTVGGGLSGSGTLIKNGSGTVALAATSSYAGAATVRGGTLRVDAANALGGAGRVDVGSDGRLVVNGVNQSLALLRGDGAVLIDGGSLTLGSADGSSTFAGTISGSGNLIKTGSGTLTLTGANTYSGGTRVDAGTVTGSTASLQGTIVNNARVAFDQATDSTFRGTLQGAGVLTKSGAGVLRLAGTHAMSGLSTVQSGTLALDGALGGSVEVRSGASFIGSGRIGGSLTAGATTTAGAAPGFFATRAGFSGRALDDLASIAATGRLEVARDVTIGAGGVYRATVDAAGNTPLLVAGGIASLDGAVVAIDTVPGQPRRVTQAAILTAAGGVRGTPIVDTGKPTLEAYLVNDGRSLLAAVLDLGVPLTPAASTANGAAVGAVLDRVRGAATGDLRTVTRELAGLDDAGLGLALDAISGEIHASALQAAAADGETVVDLVRSEVAGRGHAAGGEHTPGAADAAMWGTGRRFWGQLLGQQTSFEEEHDVRGADLRGGGFALGMDWTIGDGWLAGAGGSYSKGTLELDGLDARSRVSVPRAFGYVGYGRGRWSAHAGGTLARPSYDTRRTLAYEARLDARFGDLPIFGGVDRTATSDAHGLDTAAWGEWRLHRAAGAWSVQPAVGLRVARYGRDAWREEEAGALALSAPDQRVTAAQIDLGAHLARNSGRIRPLVEAAYRRELTGGDTLTTLQIADGTFTVTGLPFEANRVLGAAGAAMRAGDRADLSLRYRFDAGAHAFRHGIEFGASF